MAEAPDYIVWQITESEEELRASLSHPEYYAEKVRPLKPGSRRMLEVLASRVALKVLCHGEEQQVVYDEHGKPSLAGSTPPYISISHTRGYAAVISSEVPVGIDIERRENRVQRVVSHFLKHEEVARLELIASMSSRPAEDRADVPPLTSDDIRLLLLHLAWSAKEAAFKVLGPGYYDLMHLTTVQHVQWSAKTLSLHAEGLPEPLKVHFDFTDDYVLAWVQLV